MMTPFLNDNPAEFGRALQRIRLREIKAARPTRQGWLQRLCKALAPHRRREHTARVPGGETIHSNLATFRP